MSKLSPESEQIISSMFTFKKVLLSHLPQDIVEYLCELIVKDQAHKSFIELTRCDD